MGASTEGMVHLPLTANSKATVNSPATASNLVMAAMALPLPKEDMLDNKGITLHSKATEATRSSKVMEATRSSMAAVGLVDLVATVVADHRRAVPGWG